MCEVITSNLTIGDKVILENTTSGWTKVITITEVGNTYIKASEQQRTYFYGQLELTGMTINKL